MRKEMEVRIGTKGSEPRVCEGIREEKDKSTLLEVSQERKQIVEKQD